MYGGQSSGPVQSHSQQAHHQAYNKNSQTNSAMLNSIGLQPHVNDYGPLQPITPPNQQYG